MALQGGNLDLAVHILNKSVSLSLSPELAQGLQDLRANVYVRSESVLGVTGSGPFSEPELRGKIGRYGGYVGDKHIWQDNQLIVVGRRNFDKDYLTASVELGCKYGFTCTYIAQEELEIFLSTGKRTHYYKGHPRLQEHDGLRFLTTIGFKWPSTDAPVGIGGTDGNDYNDKSELSAQYGYSVKAGVPKDVRRRNLQRAVNGMGLQAVVVWIANLVKWRKSQTGERWAGAIGRYEEDLLWLYDNFYKGTKHAFIWPDY